MPLPSFGRRVLFVLLLGHLCKDSASPRMACRVVWCTPISDAQLRSRTLAVAYLTHAHALDGANPTPAHLSFMAECIPPSSHWGMITNGTLVHRNSHPFHPFVDIFGNTFLPSRNAMPMQGSQGSQKWVCLMLPVHSFACPHPCPCTLPRLGAEQFWRLLATCLQVNRRPPCFF